MQKFLYESGCKPNKLWVDKGNRFYNRFMKKLDYLLKQNLIETNKILKKTNGSIKLVNTNSLNVKLLLVQKLETIETKFLMLTF